VESPSGQLGVVAREIEVGLVRRAGLTPTGHAAPAAGMTLHDLGDPVGWAWQGRVRAGRCRAYARERSLVEGRIEGVEGSHLAITPDIRAEELRWT
jgi:hypothetical protein